MSHLDNENFDEKVKRTWGLTRGNKLTLLMLSAMLAAAAGYTRYAGRSGQATLPTRDEAAVRINVNSAGQQDLILLPGIGEKTAQLIIADRTAHGRYDSLEDLSRIKGIGPSLIRRITPYVDCR